MQIVCFHEYGHDAESTSLWQALKHSASQNKGTCYPGVGWTVMHHNNLPQMAATLATALPLWAFHTINWESETIHTFICASTRDPFNIIVAASISSLLLKNVWCIPFCLALPLTLAVKPHRHFWPLSTDLSLATIALPTPACEFTKLNFQVQLTITSLTTLSSKIWSHDGSCSCYCIFILTPGYECSFWHLAMCIHLAPSYTVLTLWILVSACDIHDLPFLTLGLPRLPIFLWRRLCLLLTFRPWPGVAYDWTLLTGLKTMFNSFTTNRASWVCCFILWATKNLQRSSREWDLHLLGTLTLKPLVARVKNNQNNTNSSLIIKSSFMNVF